MLTGSLRVKMKEKWGLENMLTFGNTVQTQEPYTFEGDEYNTEYFQDIDAMETRIGLRVERSFVNRPSSSPLPVGEGKKVGAGLIPALETEVVEIPKIPPPQSEILSEVEGEREGEDEGESALTPESRIPLAAAKQSVDGSPESRLRQISGKVAFGADYSIRENRLRGISVYTLYPNLTGGITVQKRVDVMLNAELAFESRVDGLKYTKLTGTIRWTPGKNLSLSGEMTFTDSRFPVYSTIDSSGNLTFSF